MHRGRPAVLFVDDDPDFLSTLTAHLRRHGCDFDILTETDPAVALDRFESSDRIDCIVCDHQMPGLSGVDVLRTVRAVDADVPFVLFTSRGSETVAREAINEDVTRYLTKQAWYENVGELVDVVERAIDRYHARSFIRQQYLFLETVLETIDDVMFVADADGRPVYWNQAANEVTGYSDSEARSLDVADLFPEAVHDDVTAAIEEVLETGQSTLEAPLLTKSGDRIPYEFTSIVLSGPDGDPVGICGVGRDVSKQRAYEATLESLHRAMRDLLAAESRASIAAVAADATEHIVDSPLSAVYLVEDGRLVPVSVTDAADRVLDGPTTYGVDEDAPIPRVYRTGRTETVTDVRDIDDDRDRGELRSELVVSLDGHGVLVVGVTDDRTFTDAERSLAEIHAKNAAAALSRHRRERLLADRGRMLTTLHESVRDLMQASTPDEVARVVRDAATETLGLTSVAVFLWDEDRAGLRRADESDAASSAFDDVPVVRDPGNPVWNAFVDGRTRVYTDAVDRQRASDPTTPDGGRLVVPFGQFGVFVSRTESAEGFDGTTVEFVELLVTSAGVALERTERKTTLRTQEDRLSSQNERLRRLDRINSIIRSVHRSLVDATTQREIYRAVCTHLADAAPYEFVWAGRSTADDVLAHAWVGSAETFLDVLLDGAVAERGDGLPSDGDETTPTVVTDIFDVRTGSPWRTAALNNGFRSVVRLPLVYDGHDFGFLEVYADQPDAFPSDEVAVLSELGSTVANALHNVARTETLVTGDVVSLEFAVPDADGPLSRLARRTGTHITLDGVETDDGGRWRVRARAACTSPDPLLAAAERSVVVDSASVVGADDAAVRFEFVVQELPLVELFADHGAAIDAVDLGPESTRIAVIAPSSVDVRPLVESARERYANVELVRRTPSQTTFDADALPYDVEELLTQKQLEALRTAFHAGYFSWPRDRTGEAVAEDLGVSGPTFHQHVRKGIRRLLSDVFAGSE